MMDEGKKVDRRKFIATGLAGAGILGAGAAIGWVATRSQKSAFTGKDSRAPLDDRFTYDVSAFTKVDPKLILYAEQAKIPTGLQTPSCLAVGAGDKIFVGGDREVKVLDKTGAAQASVSLAGKPNAVVQGEDGRLYVAFKNQFEVFSATGTSVLKSDAFDARTHLTALAQHGERIYAADAGNREVLICGMDGKVQSRFGKVGKAAEGTGFTVPSPYFDLLFGAEDLLWVVNPGRHLIQAYLPDGKYQTGWGVTGLTIEAFCGCCNPVHLARLPDGGFVTSEKGLNRVKVFTGNGKFVGVVAGPEQLGRDMEQVNRALNDANAGITYDIACDSAGRVLVLDPVGKQIRVFVRKTT
jgi:hypothetical protein